MDLGKALVKRLTNGGGKRHRTADEEETNDESPSSSSSSWKVVRLAAKNGAMRKQEGASLKSKQRKVSCEKLHILQDGVKGIASSNSNNSEKGWWFRNATTTNKKQSTTVIEDYNHYRTQGHEGRFAAKTRDRAVFIATVAAYQVLEKALNESDSSSTTKVEKGDLGENILLEGPPATACVDGGLFVGAKLRVGTALLELTEANNPCHRFNTQPWAPQAKKLWGATSPTTAEQWFKSEWCPLNHQVNPGIRGWLAKVIQEGETTVGDTAELVLVKDSKKKETLTKEKSSVVDSLPPAKKRKIGKTKKA